MADQKISELTALTGANAADDDALAIVDTSAVETKKITRSELFTDTPTVLVGTTDTTVYDNSTASSASNGHNIRADGKVDHARYTTSTSAAVLGLNRVGSDGYLAEFRKDGAPVGSISSRSGNAIVIASEGKSGVNFGGTSINPWLNGSITNGTVDFGQSAHRFKDLYLSGGVVFDDAGGSGTSTSNTMDSYEEGTWTPVITPEGGSAAGITVNHATYTKVGRLVSLVFDITINSISGGTSSNAIELTGMPFNSATSHGGGPNIAYGNLAGSMTGTLALNGNSTSKYRIVNLDGTSALNASDHLQATSRLEGQFTYHTT